MSRRGRGVIASWLGGMLWAWIGAANVLGGDLEVGLARVDITPPRGYRMSGYFFERLNEGVHDPLEAKAVVLRQDGETAALVFCDLIGIDWKVARSAAEQAAKGTGIPAEKVLIHGTHTHTGPLYEGVLRRYFHAEAMRKLGHDPAEPLDYSAQLAEKIAGAISAAQRDLRPRTLAVGRAQEESLSFNRRFHMKDGSVRFNPGKLNPDIVRAAGPIDPEVGVISISAGGATQPAGGSTAPAAGSTVPAAGSTSPAAGSNSPAAGSTSPAAVLTVFALHLDTVGGVQYSADYPNYLERELQRKFGADCLSIFGNGTCGDINHIDVTHDRAQQGQGEAERIGVQLAKGVVRALEEAKPIAVPRLAMRRGTVAVKLQEYPAERIAQAQRDLALVGQRKLPFLTEVEVCKVVEVGDRGTERLELPIQVVRFSDEAALVGLPGEVFVELGQAIKRASPFGTTLVVELCNDSVAYVPTRKAFAEGSYETVNSIIEPGGGEAIAEGAVRLLRELHGERHGENDARR